MAGRKKPEKVATKRKYSTRTKPSVKTPGPQLDSLIKLAELVPPGVVLPAELIQPKPIVWQDGEPGFVLATPGELTKAIEGLPVGTTELQHHLLVLMNRPEQWPSDYRVLAGPGANKKLLEITRQACQINAVRNHYAVIRNANEALRKIASENERGSFLQLSVNTSLLIRMDRSTGKSKALYDPVYAALIDEALDYVKVCPRCERLFFGARVNSVACEKCREAYRKKQQRKK